MTSMKFHVFLSHKSSDKKAIRDLKRQLEDKKLTCWLDEEQLLPGKRWVPLIGEALENSGAVLACVGSDGQGPWQDLEIEAALIYAIRLKKPVIPVLLPGTQKEATLPHFLAAFGYVDFRSGFEASQLSRLVQAIGTSPGAGAPPNPGAPSKDAAFPSANHEAQPSPATQGDARPMTPEEEKRRTEALRRKLRDVFPTTLDALKSAVSPGSPLREVMLKVFKPQSQSEEGQALELLVRFHEEFLPVVGLFIQTYKHTKNPQARSKLSELVGSVLFLSMDPDFAHRVRGTNTGADSATIPVPAAASGGIQQILGCWIQRHDEVNVVGPSGGTMDAPPQMAADLVRLNLLQRFGIPFSDPNADKLLEIQIELHLNLNDAVAVTIADREVLLEIRRPKSPLRRLLVFIKEQGASIRPVSGDDWFDKKVEVHLEALKKAISTPLVP